MYKSILFIGYPGTGKTSSGKYFESKKGYKHYSNGEELRKLSKEGNLNPNITKYMDQGLPIPANLLVKEMSRIVKKYINQKLFNENEDILILDGLPRDESQLKELKQICDIKKVFLFNIKNKEILIERILKNRDEQRKDDSDINIIMKRIQIIDDYTPSILKYFDKRNIIYVDSENMNLNQIFSYIESNMLI